MTAWPTDPDAGLLLEHAGFVRALSRSLLADEHEAEDNVQQTWLTALEHPPRHRGNLRAWLGTIARNLALRRLRRASRRAQRERKVAQPEQVPSGEGLAIRRDVRRKVVDAVMNLEEPYRSTVVLRYFRQMTPLAIAGKEGIPVETVKTRLRRALNQLRHRMDRAHEGNRATWALALAPIAFAAPAASAALKTKLAIAAVAL